jgi:hypothetical protein
VRYALDKLYGLGWQYVLAAVHCPGSLRENNVNEYQKDLSSTELIRERRVVTSHKACG